MPFANPGCFKIPSKEVPDNILLVTAVDINRALGGKLGENASKAFTEYLTKMGIKDIINSCTFPLCGVKVSEQIEAYMIDNDSADWASLPKAAYEWVFNTESPEYAKVPRGTPPCKLLVLVTKQGTAFVIN